MRGTVVAIALIAVVGGYAAATGGASSEPTKATVYLIDRKCNLVETTRSADGRTTARGYNDDCKSVEEWDTVREKRNKTVSGKAVVHVNYTAPQDGSSRTGKVEYTGRDDEFYELVVGDEIDIRVRADDPDKISRA